MVSYYILYMSNSHLQVNLTPIVYGVLELNSIYSHIQHPNIVHFSLKKQYKYTQIHDQNSIYQEKANYKTPFNKLYLYFLCCKIYHNYYYLIEMLFQGVFMFPHSLIYFLHIHPDYIRLILIMKRREFLKYGHYPLVSRIRMVDPPKIVYCRCPPS